MQNKQFIEQIQKIMENFHRKIDLARAEYRKKIADILKRIGEQKLKEIRSKLIKK